MARRTAHGIHPALPSTAVRMASLRGEAGERRNARERERPEREGHRGERHPPGEPAHVLQLVGVNGVDDAAGAEEEERLEEGVGDEVEVARERRAGAQRRHHEAQLRAGGVREHALDVGLDQAEAARRRAR